MLSRFVRGERGITLAVADRLAVALGLRLVAGQRRGKGRDAAEVVTGNLETAAQPGAITAASQSFNG